ncbi:MAG: cytochrome c biogenesis protein CcsA [Polyangiaceae bacterium]|nr:cytochrome c biogenesis protein CcsA [Polyangiaceae bacterium]
MWKTLPEFGTGVLCAIVVAAAYTFAVALAAAGGRPRLLQAARRGAYGTVALVGVAVLILTYAFLSHDFRLRYVADYSDRTMSTALLVAALWGGQTGSLLWWLFLSAVFIGACLVWLGGRYRDLQPYVLATLMGILLFFAILMLFSANPFSATVGAAPPDGKGLNFQLRNFYMIIHPPSLYIGFTSSAIPFAFAVAALVTGRLDNEWIIATRKWMLFSWLFLSIGNALGMLWAYEELGWGGYWAWDPVENAAFLPWLTATAYVHSIMIQERRGMLKKWNVLLICLTFLLTIFGTFLTRSGLIASVHSFAQSGIGTFFLYFMAVVVVVAVVLIVWRLEKLKSEAYIESALSREMSFLLNNWALLSIMLFITIATLWPRLSEWLLDQKSVVKPTFYNAWLPLIALPLIFLMGTAPLLGWRKTSRELFIKSFRWPLGVTAAAVALHFAIGKAIGLPAIVRVDPIYPNALGDILAWIGGKLPVVTSGLVAYNLAVVVQEFVRGVRARAGKDSNFAVSLYQLVAKSRRRYGGYIVHVGIALMFLGFSGRSWGVDEEKTLQVGQSMQVGDYRITYTGDEMKNDVEKRTVYAHVDVERIDARDADGNATRVTPLGSLAPHQNVYKGGMGQRSSEVGMLHRLREDLYVVVGMVNPETKAASFQVHTNPLVLFVWLGIGILVIGGLLCMWPELSFAEAGAFAYLRTVGSTAAMLVFAVLLTVAPSRALGQPTQQAPPHEEHEEGGKVDQSEREKAIFTKLVCLCGDCPKELLSSCTCSWAQNARTKIRSELARGKQPNDIIAAYVAEHGEDAIGIPPDKGGSRALWLLPVAGALLGGGLVAGLLVSWKRRSTERSKEQTARDGESGAGDAAGGDAYDSRLDDELRAMSDDDDHAPRAAIPASPDAGAAKGADKGRDRGAGKRAARDARGTEGGNEDEP